MGAAASGIGSAVPPLAGIGFFSTLPALAAGRVAARLRGWPATSPARCAVLRCRYAMSPPPPTNAQEDPPPTRHGLGASDKPARPALAPRCCIPASTTTPTSAPDHDSSR